MFRKKEVRRKAMNWKRSLNRELVCELLGMGIEVVQRFDNGIMKLNVSLRHASWDRPLEFLLDIPDLYESVYSSYIIAAVKRKFENCERDKWFFSSDGSCKWARQAWDFGPQTDRLCIQINGKQPFTKEEIEELQKTSHFIIGDRQERVMFVPAIKEDKMPDQKNGFSFSDALVLLKQNVKVARLGWNGKNMWVALQTPDEHSKMRRPYLFMRPVDGDLVPWVASQSDLLADDWNVVE